jgi:WD40 repeat protein
MNSSDRLPCCILSTCRDHPIRLWDAYDGSLRAAYVGYNHLDELAPAYALAFDPAGRKIYAGCVRGTSLQEPASPMWVAVS